VELFRDQNDQICQSEVLVSQALDQGVA